FQSTITQWIEIGNEDLQFAKHGLSMSSNVPYRLIAFHSQQCAEKYLKAYLLFKNVDFPYTHNITTLLDLCGEKDSSFEHLRDAEKLTGFAIAMRYPGEYRKLKKADATQALKLADKVLSFVRNKLSGEGFPLKK
ncbi:MAG: HEPN domain-containing protein, partial [Ignavibacteriaceae bacterium]